MIKKSLEKNIFLDTHIEIPYEPGLKYDLATCPEQIPKTVACFALGSRLCILEMSSPIKLAYYQTFAAVQSVKVSLSSSSLQIRCGKSKLETVFVELPLANLKWETLKSEQIHEIGSRMVNFWGTHGRNSQQSKDHSAEVFVLELGMSESNTGGWGVNSQKIHCAFVDNKLITFKRSQ